jgi:hypothetical protein
MDGLRVFAGEVSMILMEVTFCQFLTDPEITVSLASLFSHTVYMQKDQNRCNTTAFSIPEENTPLNEYVWSEAKVVMKQNRSRT